MRQICSCQRPIQFDVELVRSAANAGIAPFKACGAAYGSLPCDRARHEFLYGWAASSNRLAYLPFNVLTGGRRSLGHCPTALGARGQVLSQWSHSTAGQLRQKARTR